MHMLKRNSRLASSIHLEYVSSVPTRTVGQFDDILRQLFGLELRIHIQDVYAHGIHTTLHSYKYPIG